MYTYSSFFADMDENERRRIRKRVTNFEIIDKISLLAQVYQSSLKISLDVFFLCWKFYCVIIKVPEGTFLI